MATEVIGLDFKQFGKIAYTKHGVVAPLQVLHFSRFKPICIGVMHGEDGEAVVTQESVETFETLEAAEQALSTGIWTQANHEEESEYLK